MKPEQSTPLCHRAVERFVGSHLIQLKLRRTRTLALMPEGLLRDITRHQPLDAFDDRAIQSLAAKFGVSVRALTIRLTKLGLGSLLKKQE